MTRISSGNTLVYWCGAGHYMAVVCDNCVRWHKVAKGYPDSVYAGDPFELL